MDLTTEMAAQGNNDPPDRVPFSETVKALERNSRKWKTNSTNLRLLAMATNPAHCTQYNNSYKSEANGGSNSPSDQFSILYGFCNG